MKTGLFVSIAAALALMISVSTGANAVGLGKQCGTIVAFSAMTGCSAKINPGNATSPMRRVPACECQKFVQGSSARSAAATQTYPNDCERQRASVSKAHDGKCKPY